MSQTIKHDWTNLNWLSDDIRVRFNLNHMNNITESDIAQEPLSITRMNPYREDAHFSLTHMNRVPLR